MNNTTRVETILDIEKAVVEAPEAISIDDSLSLLNRPTDWPVWASYISILNEPIEKENDYKVIPFETLILKDLSTHGEMYLKTDFYTNFDAIIDNYMSGSKLAALLFVNENKEITVDLSLTYKNKFADVLIENYKKIYFSACKLRSFSYVNEIGNTMVIFGFRFLKENIEITMNY